MEIKSLADSVKNLQNLMNSVKRADAADGSIEDSPLVVDQIWWIVGPALICAVPRNVHTDSPTP